MLRYSRSWLLGLVLSLCASIAQAVPAPEDVVMYEVNLRAFSQAGDLAGVTARLDNIQSLGANTLWLMPIHPVGQVNSVGGLGSPYSIMDYGVVSSEYGSLSDLTTLVTEAHSRGMFVLMDWVGNHTAWDHPWITTHPDWYSQNGQGEIIHPPGTNWQDVADLNYDSAAMRSAMISEMQYWVTDVGIDGFRVDAADFVPYDFWEQAIPAVRGATERPLLMLAEGARDDHYAAGFDLTWGFSFFTAVERVFNSSRPATDLVFRHNQEFSSVPAGKSILRYTTNHDESAWNATPPDLFGGLDASLAAYAAVVAYGATPLVYNGQEIGWSENVPIFSKSPLDWNTGQVTEAWYSQLLAVHNNHPALRAGSIDDRSNNNIAMLMRKTAEDQVLVLVNTRDFTSSIQIPTEWQGEWFDLLTDNAEQLTALFSLDPYEVLYLSPTPSGQPGDFDLDGDVDGADFLAWQRGVSTNPPSASDLVDWQDFYSSSTPLSARSSAIPEPSALLLGVLAILTGLAARRRL